MKEAFYLIFPHAVPLSFPNIVSFSLHFMKSLFKNCNFLFPFEVISSSFPAVTEMEDKYEPLTEDIVREALWKDKGVEAQLVSWRCQDFTKEGDNYTSFVTSVIVEYKENGQGELQHVSYVAKIAKQSKGCMAKLMHESFLMEFATFNEILPATNEILKDLHMEAIRWVEMTRGVYEPDGRQLHEYFNYLWRQAR